MTILIVGLATFEEMAGGSARHVSGLAAGLRRLGHRVVVRTAAEHISTVGYSERGLAGQVARTIRRFVLVTPGTFLAVLSLRPDVVNTHFALDGLPAVVAARLAGVPVIVTFHGPWALEALATGRRGRWPLSTRARRAIERFVYRRAARCMVLSRAFGALLVSEYGVDPRRVVVVPGGLDTDRFRDLPSRAEARRRLALAEMWTIVTVRRLVPRMGLELAIEAAARLGPEVQLAAAGSGPERERLEEAARTLGIADRVTFLGRVPDADLPLLYAAADACVVPSRELEGFGYAALEALAAGTPVIAAGTGGLAELVGGLEPRWVVAADGAAIADALRALKTGVDGLPDQAACARYAATMDWSQVLPRIIAVYETARLSRGGAGDRSPSS